MTVFNSADKIPIDFVNKSFSEFRDEPGGKYLKKYPKLTNEENLYNILWLLLDKASLSEFKPILKKIHERGQLTLNEFLKEDPYNNSAYNLNAKELKPLIVKSLALNMNIQASTFWLDYNSGPTARNKAKNLVKFLLLSKIQRALGNDLSTPLPLKNCPKIISDYEKKVEEFQEWQKAHETYLHYLCEKLNSIPKHENSTVSDDNKIPVEELKHNIETLITKINQKSEIQHLEALQLESFLTKLQTNIDNAIDFKGIFHLKDTTFLTKTLKCGDFLDHGKMENL